MGLTPINLSGNNNNGSFTSGTSVTVSSTGSVPAGALMVVVLAVGGASAPTSLTPPGGWSTYLATTANGSGATVVTAVFTLVQAAAGSFSGSFSWTGTATNGHWLFMAFSQQGSSSTDGSAATTQNASGTNTSPSVTPATGDVNALLICGFFAGAVGTSTITQPSGMTSIFLAASSSSQATFGVASLALVSGSATGTKTWTIGTSHINMGLSFLIQQGIVVGFAGDSVHDASPDLVRQMNKTIMVPYW